MTISEYKYVNGWPFPSSEGELKVKSTILAINQAVMGFLFSHMKHNILFHILINRNDIYYSKLNVSVKTHCLTAIFLLDKIHGLWCSYRFRFDKIHCLRAPSYLKKMKIPCYKSKTYTLLTDLIPFKTSTEEIRQNQF